jgi:glycosyltransferase involved in cell wall biosynthesis
MHILTYCDEDLSVAAGGACQVLELCRALAARGHEVTIVAPEPHEVRGPVRVMDRVTVKTVPVVRRAGLRPLSFLVGSLKRVRREIRDGNPEIVLWFDAPGQMAPLWVLRNGSCPYVYFVNGLPDEEVQGIWRRTPVREALSFGLRCAARRAQAIVSVCPEVLARLQQDSGVTADRCAVVRNGVDPERFVPQAHERARCTLGLTGPGPYIAFVGGFFPWHGLDLLIEAVPAVAKAYRSVQFLLIGDGQTKPALEESVRRKNLGGHVRFVGRVAHDLVPVWIGASDLCVVLHRSTRSYPGDSMKLWEYLACGRPVVASAGPGYGDTVEAMGAGLAAKQDDPHDLARQVLRLLVDRDLRIKLGERGRAAVLESHTWAARAAELEAVCRRALAGGKASP